LVTFIGDKAEVFLTDSSPEKMLSEELLVQGLAKLKQDNCPNQSSLETWKLPKPLPNKIKLGSGNNPITITH